MRLLPAIAAVLFTATTAFSADVPAEVQANLQSTMQSYVDSVSTDGGYTYLDNESASTRTLYPANTHPMIIPYQDGYFLCSDMVDDQGVSHPADFLVRKIGDEYKVVQMLVGQRPLVEAAMKKAAQ